MSDEPPLVGDRRDEEHSTSDGVVLYNPNPKKRPPIDEAERAAAEEQNRTWIGPAIVTVLLLGVGAATVAVFGLPGRSPIDTSAPLPPLVPSMIGPAGGAGVTPVSDAEIVGEVGTERPVSVRAIGAGGLPIADTVVRFEVVSGAGVLASESARTDSAGVATSSLGLPAVPDTVEVLASIPGSDLPSATLRIIARTGTARQIAVLGGGDQSGQEGTLLADRIEIRVTDALDNPVPGAVVDFRIAGASGMTAPSRARTDSSGVASALWRLGLGTGRQTVTVSTPGVGSPVEIAATASPRSGDPDAAADSALARQRVDVRAATYAVGGSHVCQLRAGRATCRGANDRGQVLEASPVPLSALASGISHLCGLDAQGAAFCWGANDAGQLGDGTSVDRSQPVPVATELRFSSVTAGASHTCGLAGGGIPACWGSNLNGQLGDGSRNDQRGPRTVGGGLAFIALEAGWNHTCGLTVSGNAFCWGLNSQGQLGDGSRLDRLVPTLVRGSVTDLTAGSAHTCGVSEGRAQCWGGNGFGQLGDGTTQDRSQPVEVEGLPSAPTALAAGAVHTCALVAGGEAYCWGQNLHGQLGDGTNEDRAIPVPVSGGLRFSSLHAGGAMTCGRTTDGGEYCWGLNGSGQLGDATRESRSVPTRVGG